jgi:hypothetical protein
MITFSKNESGMGQLSYFVRILWIYFNIQYSYPTHIHIQRNKIKTHMKEGRKEGMNVIVTPGW